MDIKDAAAARVVEEFIQVSTAAATEQDFERLLGTVLASARRLMDAEAGRIYVLDQSMRNLLPVVSQNDSVETERWPLPPVSIGSPNSDQLCARCAYSGELMHVEDIRAYTGLDFDDLLRYDQIHAYRTRSLTVLPLRNQAETTVGVLQLVNADAPVKETGEDAALGRRKLLWAFASQAAIALTHARLSDENTRLIKLLSDHNDELEQENQQLRERVRGEYDFDDIRGESPAMQTIVDLLERVVDTDITILLQGETGSGKEVVARAIHRNCKSRSGDFVAVNCAAIPKDLMEGELFGHQRGAYTGADKARVGFVEASDGGTLFLDEIGDMPLELQAKLLRVLEESEVTPLGGVESRHVDLRVVAATHVELEQRIERGEFREDLYFRLCVFPLTLPALRDRREDIPGLAHVLLERASKRLRKKATGFSPTVIDCFQHHAFPGNVRELNNVIERALVLCEPGGMILLEHMPPTIYAPPRDGDDSENTSDFVDGTDLKQMLRDFEERVIRAHLNQQGWVVAQAAKSLAVARNTLIDKMQRFGIERPAGDSEGSKKGNKKTSLPDGSGSG